MHMPLREPTVTLSPLTAGGLAQAAKRWSIPAYGLAAFREIRALLNPRTVCDMHVDPAELELFGAALLLRLPHQGQQEFAEHLAARADAILTEQIARCRDVDRLGLFPPIDLRIVRLRNALAVYVGACQAMRERANVERAKWTIANQARKAAADAAKAKGHD